MSLAARMREKGNKGGSTWRAPQMTKIFSKTFNKKMRRKCSEAGTNKDSRRKVKAGRLRRKSWLVQAVRKRDKTHGHNGHMHSRDTQRWTEEAVTVDRSSALKSRYKIHLVFEIRVKSNILEGQKVAKDFYLLGKWNGQIHSSFKKQNIFFICIFIFTRYLIK